MQCAPDEGFSPRARSRTEPFTRLRFAKPPSPTRGEGAGYSSRITRRCRIAENVDGVARSEIAAAVGGIGIEREIENRERTDGVERQDTNSFHPANMPRHAGAGHDFRSKEPLAFPAAEPPDRT